MAKKVGGLSKGKKIILWSIVGLATLGAIGAVGGYIGNAYGDQIVDTSQMWLGVKVESKEVEYDGTAKSLDIKVPEGATYSVEITDEDGEVVSECIDPAVYNYKVVVTLNSVTKTYLATLTITGEIPTTYSAFYSEVKDLIRGEDASNLFTPVKANGFKEITAPDLNDLSYNSAFVKQDAFDIDDYNAFFIPGENEPDDALMVYYDERFAAVFSPGTSSQIIMYGFKTNNGFAVFTIPSSNLDQIEVTENTNDFAVKLLEITTLKNTTAHLGYRIVGNYNYMGIDNFSFVEGYYKEFSKDDIDFESPLKEIYVKNYTNGSYVEDTCYSFSRKIDFSEFAITLTEEQAQPLAGYNLPDGVKDLIHIEASEGEE
jgi:hypothetical protein